nr:hypothetical protein Hi04_10k_c5591_00023 [uncultured bacterium]
MLVLVALLLSRTSVAQERSEILAEASFTEGVRLMRADHCAEAIVKFEESQRLDPASGTALNLAYCEARLGHVATAWLTYRRAIALAEAQGKPAHAQIGQTEADKLEPDLPRLSLVVPKGGAPPAVTLDGDALTAEMWSAPIPLDPGQHEIAVTLGERRVWRKPVTMTRGERTTVELPPVPAEAAPAPQPVSPINDHVAGRNSPAQAETDTRRTWAFVLGGVGAAAVITGVALFTSARLEYDGVGGHCTNNACDDEGYSARSAASSRAKASYFVLAGGGALLGASVVLLLTNDHRSKTSMAFGGSASSWGVSLERAF